MNAGRVYIGTSGWVYKDWGKSFYPISVPPSRQLQFYAARFPTVEVNGTFSRLPTQKTFAAWNQQAPSGFLYSIKGSRAVTHFKPLRPGAKSFKLLLARSRLLRGYLGPILWQLPGSLKKDVPRLRSFLRLLDRRVRHAIEFRDPSWLDEEVKKSSNSFAVIG
jgi:uncharacterized protein YecE (DUF72 family)